VGELWGVVGISGVALESPVSEFFNHSPLFFVFIVYNRDMFTVIYILLQSFTIVYVRLRSLTIVCLKLYFQTLLVITFLLR
jgi:hypothetical protein